MQDDPDDMHHLVQPTGFFNTFRLPMQLQREALCKKVFPMKNRTICLRINIKYISQKTR